MKSPRIRAAALAALFAAFLVGPAARATIVRFSTTSGNIDFRLYNTATPLSVTNFLNYVTSHRYDGSFVHRSAKKQSDGSNFVIQGGGFKLNNSIFAASGIVTDAAVQNEPGITNIRGTLAYAKGSDPNSATSQWFINLQDNSALDLPANGAFTVFGRVVGNGMTTADSIANLGRIIATVAGPSFAEVPVYSVTKVQSQGDIHNDDAVIVNSATVLNLPKGDYDFNGIVNANDYTVWKNNFGSTTFADADGNGNGKVDAADYTIWRESLGQISGPGSGAGATVPEPASILLLTMAATAILSSRIRRGRRW